MSIGARIKRFRNQKGLTQVKLATNAGISRSYLADVEANRYNPSLSTLMDLAQALGIAVSCLLDDREIDFRNLEQACQDKGVSLESLSESLQIPTDSMELIRTNKLPDEDTMFKLCDYFNCTWDYIIGKTNSPDDVVFGNKAISIPDTSSKEVHPIESRHIPTTIAAHFENTEFTEEETKEIDNFISFLTSRRNKQQL